MRFSVHIRILRPIRTREREREREKDDRVNIQTLISDNKKNE